MSVTETEAKGLLYEGFVDCALERLYPGRVEWHPHLGGVIAEQDFVVRKGEKLWLVVGVTHWGSHETAKMKLWRIHEDVFEVHQAYPEAIFVHILFEQRTEASLAQLVAALCGGAAVSEKDCAALAALQSYAGSDAEVRSFGRGQDAVRTACRERSATDPRFRAAIDGLARAITAAVARHQRSPQLKQFLASARKPAGKTAPFEFSGPRRTHVKEALLALLQLGSAGVREVFACHARGRLDALARLAALREHKLLNTANGILPMPAPALAQLLALGQEWVQAQLTLLERALRDPAHRAYAYLDHYRDMTDRAGCAARLARLCSCRTARDMAALLRARSGMHSRCWPLDYFLAVERRHHKGKFGHTKLSTELGLKCIGGVSPLPRFAAGNLTRLDAAKVKHLARLMLARIAQWDPTRATADTIQADRRTTLLKKLPALEILVHEHLRRSLPGATVVCERAVRHPLAVASAKPQAGTTEFNFQLTAGSRTALLFLVSSTEATHKHKELSGRLRAAWAAGLPPDTRCLLLIDGNFLAGGDADLRQRMLGEAGWDRALYLDEMDRLTQRLAHDLGVTGAAPLAGHSGSTLGYRGR
jgi:hypothetical protein